MKNLNRLCHPATSILIAVCGVSCATMFPTDRCHHAGARPMDHMWCSEREVPMAVETQSRKPWSGLERGDVQIDGALEQEQVVRVLRRAKSRLKHCFDLETLRDRDVTGSVTVEWVISGTGAVERRSDGPMKHAKSATPCLDATIEGLRFPRPLDASSVSVVTSYEYALLRRPRVRSPIRPKP